MHEHKELIKCEHKMQYCEKCDEAYCDKCHKTWSNKNNPSTNTIYPYTLPLTDTPSGTWFCSHVL